MHFDTRDFFPTVLGRVRFSLRCCFHNTFGFFQITTLFVVLTFELKSRHRRHFIPGRVTKVLPRSGRDTSRERSSRSGNESPPPRRARCGKDEAGKQQVDITKINNYYSYWMQRREVVVVVECNVGRVLIYCPKVKSPNRTES